MKVRMRPMREWLITSRLALRRMRFLACGVFAIENPRVSCSSMKKRRQAKRLRRHAGSPTHRGRRGQPSALATRAVKGRAATLDDALDQTAAAAWLPFAILDGEPLG